MTWQSIHKVMRQLTYPNYFCHLHFKFDSIVRLLQQSDGQLFEQQITWLVSIPMAGVTHRGMGRTNLQG
jgi:hypothetical protein